MYLFQASNILINPPKYTYDKLYLLGQIWPHYPWKLLLSPSSNKHASQTSIDEFF